jgi:hypothetical protein
MSLPCIKHRPGCKCTPCAGGPYYVTVVVDYGCGPPRTPGTITGVTIGGTPVSPVSGNTYLSPGPGLPIVVTWTAGVFGTFTATGATRCGDSTVTQHIGSDYADHAVTGSPYTRECCGGYMFPAIDPLTGPTPTLTLTCNLGTTLLLPVVDGLGNTSLCQWMGGYTITDAYGSVYQHYFTFTITGNGTFQMIEFDTTTGGGFTSGTLNCIATGTGTNSPLSAYFPSFSPGPVDNCITRNALVGPMTVTL